MAELDWLTARPIAHRGFHDAAAGRLENTLSAAEAAAAKGFAIEVDLQLTVDRKVVVFHDDTLDRLTAATGRVENVALADLKSIPLRGTADRIPTLDELLATVAGRVPLVIELKSQFTGDRRLEAETAPILAPYAGPGAVMSFDPASMQTMRSLAPKLPRGLIADRFAEADWPMIPRPQRFLLRHLVMAASVLPQFIAYDVKALPANAPLFLRHFFALPLLTWTVQSEADRATARRWADQMIFEDFDPEA